MKADINFRRHPAPPRPPLTYIPAFDGLRALAALAVLCFHFIAGETPPNSMMFKLGGIGRYGVDLFFVLSGFLISRILIHDLGRPGALPAFFLRRTLRIWPLYFFGLLLYFFVLPPLIGRPVPPFAEQLWGYLFLSNIPETFHVFKSAGPTHYWSLAVEEHFYLVWPFLMLLSRGRVWLPLACAIATILVRTAVLALGHDPAFFTPARLDGLAWGSLVASVYSAGHLGAYARRAFVPALLAVPVLIGVYFLLSGTSLAILQIAKYAVIAVGFALLLSFVLVNDGKDMLSRVLASSPLRALGKVSFGIYVYHPFVLDIVHVWGPPLPLVLKLGLGTVLTVALAALSYKCLESPFLRMKRLRDTGSPSPARST